MKRQPDAPREPSGRIQRPRKPRPGLIPFDDLVAGIYPEGDVRNEPAVWKWLRPARERMRDRRSVELPQGLPAVWTGSRHRCEECGTLHR